MARITLFPVSYTPASRLGYRRASSYGSTVYIHAPDLKEAEMPDAGALSIDGIGVHRITTFSSRIWGWDFELLAAVLLPGQETRLEGVDLPLGWELVPVFDHDNPSQTDDTLRYAVVVSRLHIKNMIEALFRSDVDGGNYPDPFRNMTVDERRDCTWKLKIALSVPNQRKLMRFRFSVADLDDMCVRIVGDARDSTGEYGAARSLLTVGIYDPARPNLPARAVPRTQLKDKPLCAVVSEWLSGVPREIAKFSEVDENLKGKHVGFVRGVLQLGRSVMEPREEVAASGRRLVLDEDPVSFPAATRCTHFGLDWVAFGLDRRGGYFPVSGSNYKNWFDKDHMLIHRGLGCWRFVFVLHTTLHTGVCQSVQIAMIAPYLVDDEECTPHPRAISPQRGMPPAITKAIVETPFCASAISHGLARLRYLRSQVRCLNEEMGKDADLHHPRLPVMFRGVRTRIVGSDKGNNIGNKAGKENRILAEGAIRDVVSGLRPNRADFAAPMIEGVSVLGDLVDRPRALVLDM